MYGGALLRLGHTVIPVTRSTPRPLALPPGTPVLVAVGEEDLDAALRDVVGAGPLILLQNELFPDRWLSHGVTDPTVLVVWTNRKKGVVTVGGPSRVYGPLAHLVMEMHAVLGIPCHVLGTEGALHTELCAKYAFIVAVNALGVAADLALGEWLQEDRPTVEAVCRDGVALAACRVERPVDKEEALARVLSVLDPLGVIPTRGRTAPSRVDRAATTASRHALTLPALHRLLPDRFMA
jgi:hypothetical protein